MKKATRITRIFLDIGGVLLTDGWDHLARRRTAKNFKLEWAEMASCFQDRKSTRLNSSHLGISYAVFCLKNKHVLFRSDRKSTRRNSSHFGISYAIFCLKKKKNIYIFLHRIECGAVSYVSRVIEFLS